MNKLALLTVFAALASGPALAQMATDKPNLGTPQEKPLDRGPFTPQASGA